MLNVTCSVDLGDNFLHNMQVSKILFTIWVHIDRGAGTGGAEGAAAPPVFFCGQL